VPDWKGVLVKGPISPAPLQGDHHFPGERLCSLELEIAHYKWNDRAMERIKVAIDELQKAGGIGRTSTRGSLPILRDSAGSRGKHSAANWSVR
jgi:hypothetical protein